MSLLEHKVLQLNKAFEPDRVITMRRAISLLVRKRAWVEEAHGDYRIGEDLQAPSVIRLKDYLDLRKRRRASAKYRFHIMVRDKFHCQYCNVKGDPMSLSLDHVLPKSRGGSDEPENLVTACKPCNQRKGNKTPDEARMPLLKQPRALHYGLDRAAIYSYVERYPAWRPYLFLDEAAA